MNAARLTLYPILFLTALIGMLPGALFIGLIAFVIPGLILIAAPTAALYIPIIDALTTGLRRGRPGLWLPALIVLPAIALLIPMLADRTLDARIAEATAGDFARDPGGPARRLLLYDHRRSQGSARGRYSDRWLHDAPSGSGCDETCARLLLSGQVEAVIRPVASRKDGSPFLTGGSVGKAIVYTYEPATTCPAPERQSLQVNQGTLALIGSGHCIVAREVVDPGFDAAVTTFTDSLGVGRMDAASAGISQITRRAVWRCKAGLCEQTERVTSVVAERLAAPLAIGVEHRADMHMRRDFWRIPRTVNPVTAEQFLFRVFGFKAADLPTVDPAQLRAAAEAALAAAASADRRLTDPEEEAIEQTLKAISDRPEISQADIALLRTIALHPTADWLAWYGDVFRKHPQAGTQLADVLIDGYRRILGRENPERQNDLRRGLARAIADLPPETFRSRGSAILGVLARPGGLADVSTLIARLGDLGPSALPLLRQALAERGDAEAAALGLCRMGLPAAGVAPDIAAVLTGKAGSRDRYRIAAVVLARLGRPDLIRRPPAETYTNVSAAGERYDNAWFDAVPPTITPASPPEICERDTISNRMARKRR